MSDRTCAEYAIGAMARSEGFECDIGHAELDRHLEGCAGCRAGLAELADLNSRFAAVEAAVVSADLWPGVAKVILGSAATEKLLILMGALLGTGKLFEVVTGSEAPFPVEMLLAALIAFVFFLSRQPLFRIISDVPMEGDS